jgi:hypothetical protein
LRSVFAQSNAERSAFHVWRKDACSCTHALVSAIKDLEAENRRLDGDLRAQTRYKDAEAQQVAGLKQEVLDLGASRDAVAAELQRAQQELNRVAREVRNTHASAWCLLFSLVFLSKKAGSLLVPSHVGDGSAWCDRLIVRARAKGG